MVWFEVTVAWGGIPTGTRELWGAAAQARFARGCNPRRLVQRSLLQNCANCCVMASQLMHT